MSGTTRGVLETQTSIVFSTNLNFCQTSLMDGFMENLGLNRKGKKELDVEIKGQLLLDQWTNS